MGRSKKWFSVILCILMLLPMFASAELRIHFIDVGQGDSILVQCDGESLLVDAGSADAGKTVNKYLRELQSLNVIDYVIATHEHDDHIGGMLSALYGLSVRHIYSSSAVSSSYWFKTILSVLNQDSLDISYPSLLDSFQLGGATVQFINPLTEAENANDRSLAIRIEYGENAVLLTADIEAEAEASMINNNIPLKADVLKVAHHGGNTSGTEAFVSMVAPAIAIISVGAGNKHGHPHAEPVRTLEKYGVIIYRTDYDGTIVCTSNGTEWTVEVSRARNSGNKQH